MAITEKTIKLADELRTVLDQLLAASTRTLTEGWAQAWDRLTVRFRNAVLDLMASNGGKWPNRKQLDRNAHLNAALAAAAFEHERLVDLLRTSTTSTVRAAAASGGSAQAGLIASQLPHAHDPTLIRFADSALDAIVRRTGTQITSLARPLSREATAAMKRELIRGVEAGDSPETAARLMVRRVEGEFAGGLTRALTIAQTEILGAYREAAMVSQLANRDVLRGWVWISALTRRTCASCWSMHGTEHPLDEPGPDDHPRGRCSRAPLTRSWRELGFNIPEPASVIPDSRAVFAAMPKADQLAVLGPARLRLLDDGDISWSDLSTRRENPGWRASHVTTPVRDLVNAS